jgi:hypothetical protein
MQIYPEGVAERVLKWLWTQGNGCLAWRSKAEVSTFCRKEQTLQGLVTGCLMNEKWVAASWRDPLVSSSCRYLFRLALLIRSSEWSARISEVGRYLHLEPQYPSFQGDGRTKHAPYLLSLGGDN